MEPLLNFIGSYWWLGFIVAGPIVGIVGSARGWWREQEELSHKRKLELIEAKAPSAGDLVRCGAHPG